MPIPHQEMRRIIKRRIRGLEPRDRARVLRAALAELPGYYSGPYGELRRWIEAEIAEATTRRGAQHHDAYFIARQGVAQVALVGPPAKLREEAAAWREGLPSLLLVSGPPPLLRLAADLFG